MREGYDIKELVKEHDVIDVAIDDEYADVVEEALVCALEVGVVVGVEVVEPEDVVTVALRGKGDVCVDKVHDVRIW